VRAADNTKTPFLGGDGFCEETIMRSTLAALALALAFLIPTAVGAEAPPDMVVYDYTTISAPFWTPIIMATVDEFNEARPDTAPRLVYSAESGSFDCLDLPPEVANLAGIIICDTSRPGEFPYDPDAPKEGWGGMANRIDDDTTRIVLNSYIPEGFYIPAEVIDNTICHEMMHAYTGVGDNYDSDATSCVFGDLLSPGTTDVRLMQQRWPATVAEPSRQAPVTAPNPTGPGWAILVLVILLPLVYALLKLVFRLLRGLVGWGALIITGLFVLNLVSKGAGPMLREFDAASVSQSIQTTLAGYVERISATDPPDQRATAPSVPRPTPTPKATKVPAAPRAESPNETGDDDPPAVNDPEGAASDEPTAVPNDAPEAAAPPLPPADRRKCDPAYPDERTCIPPGPPDEQPCAITDERNFTVLPPDPRRLDVDGDGIGCEPNTP
jgi:micrococcal nuclease